MIQAIKLNGGIWYRLPGTGLDILLAPIGPHIIHRQSDGVWDFRGIPDWCVTKREHSDKLTGFYAACEPEYL